VIANHFLLNFDKDATDFAVHYDVDIQGLRQKAAPGKGAKGRKAPPKEPEGAGAPDQPATEQRGLRPLPADKSRVIIAALAAREAWPTGWSYDGRKSMYAPGNFLPGGPAQDSSYTISVSFPDEGTEKEFTCRVRRVNVISFDALRRWVQSGQGNVPYEALQAIEVIMRHRVCMMPSTVAFGRSIFVPHSSTQFPLGDGAEVWLGYQQSARPCQRGITVTINQAASAFVAAGPVIELLAQAANMPASQLQQGVRTNSWEFKAMKQAVTGIKVEVTHMGNARRQYRVTGLSTVPADQDMFDHEELGRISVAQYFGSHYRHRLMYPKLPCLRVGSKGVRLPPEVCVVKAGMRVRRLTPQQTQSMIRVAASAPDVKRQSIQTQMEQNLQFHRDPQAAAFGINIDTKMMQVNARILDAPTLQYKLPPKMQVSGGSWNLKQCRFLEPSKINAWAFCCFISQQQAQGRGPDEGLNSFINTLGRKLFEIGITWRTDQVKQPVVKFLQPGPPESMQQTAAEGMAQASEECRRRHGHPASIIICVLPTKDSGPYRAVKWAGDHAVGIVTQCIVASNAGITRPPKGLEQYCANVAMKVNAKLGGTNVTIFNRMFPLIADRPFMLIGADVTHPPPGSDNPSIAGVVGSLDGNCAKYATRILVQGPRDEIISELDRAVKELLQEFERNTRKKPERIVFYRDGVSEGQFATVMDQELPLLRKAFRDVSQNEYQPLVTFVVVQKRHNTRLFPKPGEGDRKGNILPGTVVDRDICHPFEFDFYLNSHEGLQGTVRPSHYHVLMDENKFQADQLQILTHHLCYLFCRCTRSVSVCPPAYYAHLAAERGRLLCSAYSSSGSETESAASGQAGQKLEIDQVNAAISGRMFFV